MVLLDTGIPGTSREIYSEDADGNDGNAKYIMIKSSFPYITLKFICRRFVSFIIMLGNGKLLNSVSDTFVNIVF